MAGEKVVINLVTGLEDPERVTRSRSSSAGAALEQGKQVDDVPDQGSRPPGAPRPRRRGRLRRLPASPAAASSSSPSRGGELLVCPICVNSRGLAGAELVANARLGGATPLWEWIGDDRATVFSY